MNNPDFMYVIGGDEEPLEIFQEIVECLSDLDQFPFLVEEIYRTAIQLDEASLDRLRFALLRLQIFADIHRYEDMETYQKMKYVGQVLEKVIFGNLLLEHEEVPVGGD